ncbi:MAG: endonuclease/exonuclease/phosphatase family protein [Alphaproteobacteria bacterium]
MENQKDRNNVVLIPQILVWILCLATLASLGARWSWFLDLFSHFSNQYIIGGALLIPILILAKSYRHAALCAVITLLTLIETRLVLDNPLRFLPSDITHIEKGITVVQYNQSIRTINLEQVQQWLNQNSKQFDIIVLQEASHHTVDMANSLKRAYPHQIHEGRHHPFGMVILSKYKIVEEKINTIPSISHTNIFIRVEIETPKHPTVLYAIHTMPPVSKSAAKQRNHELSIIAEEIASDQSEHIILVGDFNLTPTSPYFARLKEETGLKYQSFGLLQNPTWHKNHVYPFLKIPIDHVLYSTPFLILDKRVGPAFSSDHHSLIVTLGQR